MTVEQLWRLFTHIAVLAAVAACPERAQRVERVAARLLGH